MRRAARTSMLLRIFTPYCVCISAQGRPFYFWGRGGRNLDNKICGGFSGAWRHSVAVVAWSVLLHPYAASGRLQAAHWPEDSEISIFFSDLS